MCIDNGIHTQLVNEFYLSPLDTSQLSHYFILHWSGSHLSSCIDHNQTVHCQGINYIPVFQKATRCSILNADQVKLSFRKHKNGNIPPYVLIRIL